METFLMSVKERARLEAFGRVKSGDLSLRGASEVLGLSYRQTKRSWTRYQAQGSVGLAHQLRGKPSNRQSDGVLKQRVLELYLEKYPDYGPTLAAECLASEDALQVPAETLRRWLKSGGLWSAKRRRKPHRRRRPRKEHFGELVQMDGSIHDWFEGRRGHAVLMVMIDDATSRVWAQFFERETLEAAWTMSRQWLESYGLPRALYVDRHSIYRNEREPTAEELVAGIEPPTQFGRSLNELQVGLIMARSPQAKGRVERMNGTLQDRLVKALRRAGISDLEEANRFLREEFLPPFNDKFSCSPEQPADLHRALEPALDLDRIMAVHEERVVQNDWTIRWKNRFLQLPPEVVRQGVQPKSRVTICEQLDGRVRVFFGEQEMEWSATRTPPGPKRRPRAKGEIHSSQGQRPKADHPWKRRFQQEPPADAARPELAGSVPVSLRSTSTAPANSGPDLT